MDTAAIVAAVARVLGPTTGARPVVAERRGGGDIHDGFRVHLDDGTSVFAKVRRAGGPSLPQVFEREAAGLHWLGDRGAVRVPDVLAAHDEAEDDEPEDDDTDPIPSILVLEWIDAAPPAPDHDERLGRSLAALHRSGAPHFGFATDNYLGTLVQHNDPRPTWAELYGRQRLEPLVRTAVDRGWLPSSIVPPFEALLGRLDERCGPHEPPARLHGDLWAGNAMTDELGLPVLVDPAVYGGHREIDLAMMRLFGGFTSRVFAAYDEAHPLADGHAARVPLYQLYPLLAHVHLFPQAGYQSAVVDTIHRLA